MRLRCSYLGHTIQRRSPWTPVLVSLPRCSQEFRQRTKMQFFVWLMVRFISTHNVVEAMYYVADASVLSVWLHAPYLRKTGFTRSNLHNWTVLRFF